MERITAEQLRVGDTIEVWWSPRRDTITALKPYKGPLVCLKGARLADFAILKTGMTIEPGSMYNLVARAGVPNA